MAGLGGRAKAWTGHRRRTRHLRSVVQRGGRRAAPPPGGRLRRTGPPRAPHTPTARRCPPTPSRAACVRASVIHPPPTPPPPSYCESRPAQPHSPPVSPPPPLTAPAHRHPRLPVLCVRWTRRASSPPPFATSTPLLYDTGWRDHSSARCATHRRRRPTPGGHARLRSLPTASRAGLCRGRASRGAHASGRLAVPLPRLVLRRGRVWNAAGVGKGRGRGEWARLRGGVGGGVGVGVGGGRGRGRRGDAGAGVAIVLRHGWGPCRPSHRRGSRAHAPTPPGLRRRTRGGRWLVALAIEKSSTHPRGGGGGRAGC